MSWPDIDRQRAIIDRRALADRLSAIPMAAEASAQALAILAQALAQGRAEIGRRLNKEPGNGRAAAEATCFLHDQLVRLTYDFVSQRMTEGLPSNGLALVGLGGTGRGEMAPFSDLDLMFLTESRRPPHSRASRR